ncbi:CTP:phosphocholine cytidylyltransferase involved in choline phosphorylation for cell surface LPS epitopes [Mycoplasmopsis bovigenitalium]|uniref:CTP:phosphocholine cytidylyltransferase involved in choline phosphorylation for cell surface LPS epitopes n=1 Tax=Mycoplasmopsis bovigenitalium TaxID=2112 RepID=A0A449AA53_9BACT|nr:sugar phosphate nucleotidyltransferase [Mycoplasmopsis bovigenitalium]VEU61128.1 CTP:phosphocholine cytidylyltransferase involved in choline phosphorylation for cell surface LPS epitopes [Mycoplasmopsis bovigenitalium]
MKNVIILAAGLGSRLTPLTLKVPKGSLEIKENTRILTENLKYLENFDNKIIVTGYKRKKFTGIVQYYNLFEVYNKDFKDTNSLYSLYLALKQLKKVYTGGGVYILTSDVIFNKDIFNKKYNNSWINTQKSKVNKAEWEVIKDSKVVKNFRIRDINQKYESNIFDFMTGCSYIHDKDLDLFIEEVAKCIINDELRTNSYWEQALWNILDKINLKTLPCDNYAFEIDNFNDLLTYNPDAPCFKQDIHLREIMNVFSIEFDQISNIKPVKQGMTNDSFTFDIKNKTYIARIPKKSSRELINRYQEKEVYQKISDFGICEEVIHFSTDDFIDSPLHGFKIAKFYKNALVANGQYYQNMKKAMLAFKDLHTKNIQINHEFDLLERKNYYTKEIGEHHSKISSQIRKLEVEFNKIYDWYKSKKYPTHLCLVDGFYENVLILKDGRVKLIDWEYAGASDGFTDIAGYCLSCVYNEKQVAESLNIYLGRKPTKSELNRLYAQIIMQAILWVFWCEYKKQYQDFFSDYEEELIVMANKYLKRFKYE